MVILNISYLFGSLYKGVDVVVPMHVQAQSKFAQVGLLNVNNVDIPNVDNFFKFEKNFDINKLPSPFNKPDIVVFHELYRVQYLKIYKNLLKNKIPYVIVPHGELRKEAQQQKRIKKLVANFLLFNRFVRKSKGIQCLSQKELENTNFKHYKFIGTNGVEIPTVCKKEFNNEIVKLIYVGRLDVYVKGLELLLKAMKLVKEKLNDKSVMLSIYGPDILNRFAQVKSIIDGCDVNDLVNLNYAISGKEKVCKLLESDIFIQTSRHEGMPMGILEAMSYGLPCIVTEGTTLRSFVEDNDAGWGAETDETSIANAILLAIKQKEKLYEKSTNARKAVTEKFSWEIIEEKTIEKYKELV